MPDVRGVLLVALAVVVLLAMMRTGLSAGPDEVVTKAERERLEEAFGHAGGGDAGGGSEPDEGDADAGEGSGGPAEADAGEEEAPPPKPAQRRRKA
jgi:hypothetical protein